MVKRYLLTIFAFLLLLCGYALTLVPLLVVEAGLKSQAAMTAYGLWGGLVFVSLLPVLNMLLKKIWFFRGMGKTVPLATLKKQLLAINEVQGPVQVREKKNRLIVTWHVTSPKWCEWMNRHGMNRLYELHLRFDSATNTVETVDRVRSLQFIDCPEKVKTGFFSRPKPFLQVGLGKQWGVENYRGRNPEEYSYHSREIKSPVVGTLLKNGWNVRFCFF